MPGIIDALGKTRNRTTKLTLLVCVASYIGFSGYQLAHVPATFDPLHYAAGLVALLFIGGGVDALQTVAGRDR